jgi:hypothetical protein
MGRGGGNLTLHKRDAGALRPQDAEAPQAAGAQQRVPEPSLPAQPAPPPTGRAGAHERDDDALPRRLQDVEAPRAAGAQQRKPEPSLPRQPEPPLPPGGSAAGPKARAPSLFNPRPLDKDLDERQTGHQGLAGRDSWSKLPSAPPVARPSFVASKPRTNGTLPTGFMSATPQPAFQAPLRDITVAPAARGALRGPAAAAPSLIDAGPAARALASPAQPRVAARASCEPSTSARSLSSPAQQSADALASPALLDLRQNHGARGRAPVLEGQAQSELVVMRPKGDRSGGCSTSRHSGVSNCMTTNVLVAQVSCGACKKCAPCPAPQPETEPCHPCPVVY